MARQISNAVDAGDGDTTSRVAPRAHGRRAGQRVGTVELIEHFASADILLALDMPVRRRGFP